MTDGEAPNRANLTGVAMLAGLAITAVWVWKRLTPDAQDYVVDRAVPLAAAGLLILVLAALAIRSIRLSRTRRQERARLIAAFQREPAQKNRLELSFALAELNGYRCDGLEPVAAELKALWLTTLKQAVDDKQHRIRGMAASHLGILQDPAVVPPLLAALDDDHAYVRSCAALGLGRLRAAEAEKKLAIVAEEDWDQTVRSRAREALERIRRL